MTAVRLQAALVIVTLVLSACACARSTSPAEPAASSAEAAQLEAEIGKRFRRPVISGYLMLPDSFVGGTFPAEIASLLREVEELEGKYVSVLQAASATPPPVIEAHQAFVRFAGVAAELYEIMAAASASVKSMRDGLEISDDTVFAEYNRLVDEANAARDEFEAALQPLSPEQRATFRRMGLTLYPKKQ